LARRVRVDDGQGGARRDDPVREIRTRKARPRTARDEGTVPDDGPEVRGDVRVRCVAVVQAVGAVCVRQGTGRELVTTPVAGGRAEFETRITVDLRSDDG